MTRRLTKQAINIILILAFSFNLTAQSDSGLTATHYQRLNILTIGDSNGASDTGWPMQLQKMMPRSLVINKSVSGNTIGFDNNGKESLNTLKNIDRYLDEARKEITGNGEFDYILFCIGTNDTKQIFRDQQEQVIENLSKLIELTREYFSEKKMIFPTICVITPPPMDETKVDKEKYGGGNERIRKNNIGFKKVSKKNHVHFIDTYSKLKDNFGSKTTDGVHLTEEAQKEMAGIIMKRL